ncbi:hypothetical protein VTG60DRAFT_5308 [Thermothelomyces hinnuleus]
MVRPSPVLHVYAASASPVCPVMDKSNNNPPAPRSVASEPADREPDACFPAHEPTLHVHGPSPSSSSNPPSSEAGAVPVDSSKPTTRVSLPVSLPSLFLQRSRIPSASIAPSTAEGKPIPPTDPADAHRTSALQKLNSKYPSASRSRGYTPDVSGAQSSTYSQPVLVRTYSGPPPSQGSRSARSRHYRPPSSSRGVSRRVPLPSSSAPGSSGPGQPIQPTVSDVGVGTTSSVGAGIDGYRTESDGGNVHGGVNMLPPTKAKKAATSNSSSSGSKLNLPWPWPLSSRQEPEKLKLPPLEAFSFKSFLADLEARGTDNDIGADLDRIAEICARSRYSLSNQYEVHVAPHGSGASFITGPVPSSSVPRTTRGQRSHSRSRSRGHVQGPTLQVITSDDENPALLPHPKRRSAGGKRRSTAYGTLETIMSSSRSSEEGKATKKSAAELVSEVRGRAARKAWANNPNASVSGSSSAGNAATGASTLSGQHPSQQQDLNPTATKTSNNSNNDSKDKLGRRKSASFATAIMDTSSSSRSGAGQTTSTTTESSSTPSTSSSRRQQTKTRKRGESASALLSDPAWPQTSGGHLGVEPTTSRPAGPASSRGEDGRDSNGPESEPGSGAGFGLAVADAHSAAARTGRSEVGAGGDRSLANSSWGSWIPWRTTGQAMQHQHQQQGKSGAEGRLRQLLKNGGDGGTR